MTRQPASPAEPSGGQSFTAKPSDQARTYQASRDQTINEHHHYAPPRSLKMRVAWSLAGVTVLVLGGLVGIDLWERHSAVDTAPVGDAKAPAVTVSASPSASPTPSATPEPSGKATADTSSMPVSGAPAQRAEQEPAPSPKASESAAALLPDPATRCTGWRDSGADRVQVKACGRVDGGHLYMSAEWRTTSGHALVDVYMWLADHTGRTVVYPGASAPNGMAAYGLPAWPTPKDGPQWKEYEVRKPLVPGEKYEVSVSVREAGGPAPKIFNPAVQGYQFGIVYG
ncbi:hypothetical protein [Streptomyces sp. NRRL S-340]|uniref:hypothetical protein n=1 Tax=Streptomyces sp. NRRL S-340 TaxID=1463901 RepID=UPI00131B4317|nr:hypothetical protein [Streptomyces sp. NRRL S-340]